MYQKNWLFFVAAILLLGSCAIHEEINFLKDFSGSGSFSYSVYVISEGEEGDSIIDAQLKMAEEYTLEATSIPGIFDVQYFFDSEESAMRISYHFKDIDALNALYKLDIFEEAPHLIKTFKKKGKKSLSVEWPVKPLTEEDREKYEDEYQDMYTTEFNLNFTRGIKSTSFDVEGVEIKKSENSLQISGPWSVFHLNAKPIELKVKLK